MLSRHEQFIRERQYVMNVSPATVRWYTHAFKWMPCEMPTNDQLTSMVVSMREAGLKPTGCNAVLRAVNAYLHWANSESGTKCGAGCKHPHVRQMKEPTFIPQTFTAEQVRLLLDWKPTGFYGRRLHLLVLILLDSGARISEALGLKVSDVAMDDLLLTFTGKGRKQRRTPFSLELRRVMFRYIKDFEKQPHDWLLSSKGGEQLGRCVCLRAVKHLCDHMGFPAPARTLHAFRHTAALNYVRKGGSVFHLQKMLGHTSLEMSRRYANLSTGDLSSVHERISLLGR
jgi:integrase/recombinase XerD